MQIREVGEIVADVYGVVIIRLKAVGSAPILQRDKYQISAPQKFEQVVVFVRKLLKCKPQDSVFLYVNSVFAPALDEVVGNLHRVSLLLLLWRVCLWGDVGMERC